MRAKPAQLILKSGEIFDGEAFGYTKEKVGELVFNTSMTGYQEIITDLSYTDQLICFTYPHIGNVGTNIDDHESVVGGASGVVIRDLTRVESNWRNELSLADFLKANKVPGIKNIDTRKLTRVLRNKGSQPAFISYKKKQKKTLKNCLQDLAASKAKIWLPRLRPQNLTYGKSQVTVPRSPNSNTKSLLLILVSNTTFFACWWIANAR